MLLSPFSDITGKEVAGAEEVPSSHSSCVQHLHEDFTSDGSQVSGVSVKVNVLVFIDVRCVNMPEFFGAGTPKFFVSVDTLFKETRLVPFDSLDVFRRRASVVRVHKLEFLF